MVNNIGHETAIFLTHTILHTEIPASLGSSVTNTPSVKMSSPQTNYLFLYFRKNHNMLRILSIVDWSSFFMSSVKLSTCGLWQIAVSWAIWSLIIMEVHIHSFIHSVACLSIGPQPPAKQFLQRAWSSSSSFNIQYPLVFLRSSSSCLSLLPRLPVTYILPFYLPFKDVL